MRGVTIGLVTAFMLTGCAEAQSTNDGRLKIAVMRDGHTEVNGKPTSDVAASLRAAPEGTLIVYYREDGQSQPTEAQMAVFISIIETAKAQGMPIQLSATPDFATVIDDQGRVAPR